MKWRTGCENEGNTFRDKKTTINSIFPKQLDNTKFKYAYSLRVVKDRINKHKSSNKICHFRTRNIFAGKIATLLWRKNNMEIGKSHQRTANDIQTIYTHNLDHNIYLIKNISFKLWRWEQTHTITQLNKGTENLSKHSHED